MMFERTPDDSGFVYADPLITEWQQRDIGPYLQTATGYGSKLRTSWIVRIGTRWHRVYCVCYSNVGTCYVIRGGKRYIVRESFPEAGIVQRGDV